MLLVSLILRRRRRYRSGLGVVLMAVVLVVGVAMWMRRWGGREGGVRRAAEVSTVMEVAVTVSAVTVSTVAVTTPTVTLPTMLAVKRSEEEEEEE